MAYKRISPLPIIEGGTQRTSIDANTVVCGGTTATGALQNVSGVGESSQALTSQGAGSLPIWAELSNATFFEPLASDPSDPTVGQVWYNTTSQEFKGAIDGGSTPTWTTKASSGTSQGPYQGAAGDDTDGLVFGDISVVGLTQLYDGGTNSWSTKNSMNTSRKQAGGGGTTSDALGFGGGINTPTGVLNSTESFDGTNWSAENNMNTARRELAGCGTTGSDCLSIGGWNNDFGGTIGTVERWNGTSWTAKTSLNTVRKLLTSTGTGSDALAVGGNTNAGTLLATNEQYDGTANTWSTKASMSNARRDPAAAGTVSDALVYGGVGSSGTTGVTEQYNGTSNSWTTVDSMNTALATLGGCGLVTGALAMLGGSVVTEKYEGVVGPTIVVFDITAA